MIPQILLELITIILDILFKYFLDLINKLDIDKPSIENIILYVDLFKNLVNYMKKIQYDNFYIGNDIEYIF